MEAKNIDGLRAYTEEKRRLAIQKVDEAIRRLSLNGCNINFNSVINESGVSKSFLYTNQEIRERIEDLRKQEVSREINQRASTDKTSKAKDIIIMAKDKKISELEGENRKLKRDLEVLRGKIYSM